MQRRIKAPPHCRLAPSLLCPGPAGCRQGPTPMPSFAGLLGTLLTDSTATGSVPAGRHSAFPSKLHADRARTSPGRYIAAILLENKVWLLATSMSRALVACQPCLRTVMAFGLEICRRDESAQDINNDMDNALCPICFASKVLIRGVRTRQCSLGLGSLSNALAYLQ